jgi:hypothetical protein
MQENTCFLSFSDNYIAKNVPESGNSWEYWNLAASAGPLDLEPPVEPGKANFALVHLAS